MTDISVGRPCPLCGRDPRGKRHLLNEVPICKKCRNAFANRRQLAFILEAFLVMIASRGAMEVLPWVLSRMPLGNNLFRLEILGGALISASLSLRDGFSGYSPAKWLLGLRTVDAKTLEPIGFAQSLQRNWFIWVFNLLQAVPPALAVVAVLAHPVYVILLIACSQQLLKGKRWGDGFAHTLVVWVKYQHKLPFDKRGILCLGCGYDLTGNVSGICPECGTPVSAGTQRLAGGSLSAASG